jgi:hypothetical protein
MITKLPTRGLAALKEPRCRGFLRKMKLLKRSAVGGYVIIREAEFRWALLLFVATAPSSCANAKIAPAAAV